MRLDKFLCDMQLGTRSQIKEAVKKGLVSVNGIPVRSPDHKLDEKRDTVVYMGKVFTYQNLYYYMLHKPAGVVTATKDNREPTVMDLLSGAAGKDLFPVGRLDKDTEGLLLITNDGDLAHRLLSPRKHVENVLCGVLRRAHRRRDRLAGVRRRYRGRGAHPACESSTDLPVGGLVRDGAHHHGRKVSSGQADGPGSRRLCHLPETAFDGNADAGSRSA